MTLRTIEKGGLTFEVEESSGTAWGFWDYWAGGQWEPPTLAAAERLLNPGDVLLDIGAWVGPLTLWAAKKIGAHVIAVEPDPVAMAQLQRNVDASDLAHMVTFMSKAVSLEKEVVLHTTPDAGDAYSSVAPQEHLSERITVPGVSLRDLVAEYEPQLVKIDIEGGEAAVLGRDGAALRERNIPLLLATHPQWYPDGAVRPFLRELKHWRLVEDLHNQMWLYEPRKS